MGVPASPRHETRDDKKDRQPYTYVEMITIETIETRQGSHTGMGIFSWRRFRHQLWHELRPRFRKQPVEFHGLAARCGDGGADLGFNHVLSSVFNPVFIGTRFPAESAFTPTLADGCGLGDLRQTSLRPLD
jgi:hypothetical protein